MSRNTVKPKPEAVRMMPEAKVDRRVRQTRDALGDALVQLMHEKRFETITVQHVLDRAGVSRSTFYTHYRDKDDLFLSDVEDFLEMTAFALSRRGDQSRRVAPVREFFAHIAEWRQFHSVLVAAGKIQDFLDLSLGYFARGIEQRLGEIPESAVVSKARRTALAQMFAGALVSLMSWWINSNSTASPAEMDEAFHRMVWSGVAGNGAVINTAKGKNNG